MGLQVSTTLVKVISGLSLKTGFKGELGEFDSK